MEGFSKEKVMINLSYFTRREFEAIGICEPYTGHMPHLLNKAEFAKTKEEFEEIAKEMISGTDIIGIDEILINANWDERLINAFKGICKRNDIKLYTLEVKPDNSNYYYKEKIKIKELK